MTIKIMPLISSVDEDVKPIMGKLTCLLLDNGYELQLLSYEDGSILVNPPRPKTCQEPRGCCCKPQMGPGEGPQVSSGEDVRGKVWFEK